MGVVPDSVRSARYWRYCQNKPETFCNIAEIEFIDSIGNVMQGTIIGTDGYFGSNSNMTKEAVSRHLSPHHVRDARKLVVR